jgi:adenine deaminase
MAAYGLTKEEALTAITLSAAKILGIEAMTGSLEKGKDANIVISEGDLLDMKSSKVTQAFIQGRDINWIINKNSCSKNTSTNIQSNNYPENIYFNPHFD